MIKKIFSSAFWRMAASACSFFSVPVLLEKIGVDDYAVWVTLTSLIGWLSLFDFGAGYSLRNRIAESKALNETTALETVMKGNFTFFCINALFALVVFGGSLCFVDIFKNYTLLAVLLYVPLIVSFPTFLGPFIYQGLGRIPEMNFLQFLPQFLWLVFIFAFRGLTNDKLLVLCIGFTSIQLVLRLILFVRAMRYLNMPFKGMFSMGCLKETADSLKSGVRFLMLQLSSLVLFSLGNVVTYSHLSLSDVSRYDVVNKIFILLIALFNNVITVFWTEISKAKAVSDGEKLNVLWRKLYLMTLGINVVIGIFVPTIPWFLNYWTVGKITVSLPLLWWFLAQFSIQSLAYAGGVFLNAFEILKWQIIISVIAAASFLPVSVFVFNRGVGISGVPMSVCLVLIPSLIYTFVSSRHCVNNVRCRCNKTLS